MLRDGRKESNKVDDMGDVSEGSKHTSSTGQADAILKVTEGSRWMLEDRFAMMEIVW